MAAQSKTHKQKRAHSASHYKSFRLSKKLKNPASKPLPNIIKLIRLSIQPIKKNKRGIGGIIGLQFVLSFLFFSGIARSVDFAEIVNLIRENTGELTGPGSDSAVLFSYLLSSSAAVESVYQFLFLLITSLAIIWAIRQTMAGEKVGLKQSYYEGMYPLIPFTLVLAVISLQLIPFIIGNFLISTVINNGLAATVLEQAIWWLIFIVLTLLSLYMVLSSVFALYIVTLPNMTPLKALRSSRTLVLHRRINIFVRLLGLPVLGLVFYAAVLIPLILIAPIVVVPIFSILSAFSLFFVHSYIYNLYRELL